MTTPLVSVLIDTYNHEKYIEQAVLSAIEQDFPASEFEILVVDDGSTDRTPEIVRKFAPRVRLLQKENGGQASAFNAALPEIKGDIVALLDGDDWFAPCKLSTVACELERHPEAGAVAHAHYEYHEDTGERILRSPGRRMFLELSTPEAANQSINVGWPFLVIGALTIRRKVLGEAVPIPERLRFLADGPVAWAAMASGTIVFDQALCYYRYHSANLYAMGPGNKMRQRSEMIDQMYEAIEATVKRIGVEESSLRASLYPAWISHNRTTLAEYGGRRVRTFHNEMRAFRLESANPTLAYRLFKYLVVGSMTMSLPAQKFYRMREWYGQRHLGRLRERLARSR